MTTTVRRWRWSDPLAPLVDTLERGGMLAVPTESSYGLAVDPRNARGVDTIYRFKGRARTQPLPVVLGELEHLRLLGGDPEAAELSQLARLWPAPLTVVVPLARSWPATSGLSRAAIRIPAHARLRQLLSRLGGVLTATSANPSGEPPVSSARALVDLLAGWPSAIVDDGDLPGGAPSTIVEPTARGIRVLREGAVSLSDLRESLSQVIFSAAAAEISADDSV